MASTKKLINSLSHRSKDSFSIGTACPSSSFTFHFVIVDIRNSIAAGFCIVTSGLLTKTEETIKPDAEEVQAIPKTNQEPAPSTKERIAVAESETRDD
jgi:hypothetical protein